MLEKRSEKTRMKDRREWRARIICYTLVLCALLFIGACGAAKETPPSSQAATDPGTTARRADASATVESTSPSSGKTASDGESQAVDFSFVLDLFFDGKVIGTRSESGLVVDYVHDRFDAVQEAFESLDLPVDLQRDLVYPQVTFDTEDARSFNELIQSEVKTLAKSWSDILGLDPSMLSQYREDVYENGFAYEDYGVIETEKYLSIIRLHAFTMNGFERPVYDAETYVFDKRTGELLKDRDIINLAADGENGVYESLQDLYSDLAMDRADLDRTVYSYYNTEYLRDYFDARAGAKKITGEEGYFFGGITSYYVDADGEPRVLINFRTHFPDLDFFPRPQDIDKYDWYTNCVADVRLSDLKGEKTKRENELFGIMSNEFGLSQDAVAFIAYIGEGDLRTAYIFQELVDRYHLDIGEIGMSYGVSSSFEENENAMMRSVYLVIPKYVNTLSWVDRFEARGIAILGLKQDEDNPQTISIHDGERLIELSVPIRYDEKSSDLTTDGIIDFTIMFEPCSVPPSEIDELEFRQEIEDFLYPIRVYG